MHNSTLKCIAINLEKYKYLADSASFTARNLGIESIVKSNMSLLDGVSKNSILGNQSSVISNIMKKHENAIMSLNNRSHLLTKSEEIQNTLDRMLKSFGVAQISSLGSTARNLGIKSIVKSNMSLLNGVSRDSILGNQFMRENIQNRLSDLISYSNGDVVTKMLESIRLQPLAVLNTDYIPSETELIIATEVLQDSDQHSFSEIFKKLPTILQIVIVYLFMSLIDFTKDVGSNIIANLLTPHIQQFIENDLSKSYTDKIRTIKKAPKEIIPQKINISYLRFITAKNGLHVRSDPSIKKSKIKDTIYLGQIIEVLDKKKNWIKISYIKEDKHIKGWVLTRYTKKFNP